MKLIKSLVLSSILLVIFFIAGCNEAPVTSDENIGTGQQLSKTATSATLHIWNYFANEQTINIYAINSPWEECVVTWNTQPTTFPGIESSFSTSASGWLTADVTALVNKWLNGTINNYGLLLSTTGTNLEQFDSREGTNVPYIRIVYSDGSEDVIDIADTELNEAKPGENFCDEVLLFNGIVNGYQKYSLLKFDVEYTPEEVCETAFAFDGDNLTSTIGTCFLQYGFDRWGWSIYLPEPGTYTFPVYAGAGQCDITKGTYVGDVTAAYSGGTVSFTYDFEPGFSTSETHFYAGKTTVARDNKGKPTVAPGQYKIGTGLTGGIYIIAHAVVCSSDWD
jgi:hypothetical protein